MFTILDDHKSVPQKLSAVLFSSWNVNKGGHDVERVFGWLGLIVFGTMFALYCVRAASHSIFVHANSP